MAELLRLTEHGLYCEAGGFYVDPWGPVDRAVITHAHGDHARWGSKLYLTAEPGVEVLRNRLAPDAAVTGVPYGQCVDHEGVRVSLHPAGHLLGSSQVRIEHGGEVWVVTGDYKLHADPTCARYEPVRSHTLLTESTFALPIYRWPDPDEVLADINGWWRKNQDEGRTSIIFAYALGKSQRILAGLDASIGPIIVHGAVMRFVKAYESAGVAMPPVLPGTLENAKLARGRGMVIAPPSADGSPWLRKFAPISRASASGWMRIRGTRRRRNLDRGFVLSDHADWPGLMEAIRLSGAERIAVTHGYTHELVRFLKEQGKDAWVIPTRFKGESGDDPDAAEESPPADAGKPTEGHEASGGEELLL
jgi:putative mRNA 3-end processing factor